MSIFILVLTGSPNVNLPMSNFFARLKSGTRSYLQATIPYTNEYSDFISNRTNGDLLLYHKTDNDSPQTLVVSVSLDGIQTSFGADNRSIVLTGWRQSTNSSPSSHSIPAISFSKGTGVALMAMPGYDPNIKPGDTVVYEGNSLVANTVSIQAGAMKGGINLTTSFSEGAY